MYIVGWTNKYCKLFAIPQIETETETSQIKRTVIVAGALFALTKSLAPDTAVSPQRGNPRGLEAEVQGLGFGLRKAICPNGYVSSSSAWYKSCPKPFKTCYLVIAGATKPLPFAST